jgi:hypothetical protein
MTVPESALGDPDDAGSVEPYDSGKDEKVFEDLDKGTLGEGKPAAGEEGEPEKKVEEEEEEEELEGEDGKKKDKVDEKEEPPEPTEDDTLHSRPTYTSLKKSFPDIFKKFPELRAMLFREPEFSKLFPTVREAKETAQYADNVRVVEQDMAQGNSQVLLEQLQQASPAILARFVENLPLALHDVSKEAYVKMTTPIIKNAVILARRHARGMNDKDLWNGLDHIEKFLFGDHRFSLKKEAPQDDPLKAERESLAEERQKIQAVANRSFEGRVKDRSQTLLKKEFIRGLDPKNTMLPRMRDLIVRQGLDEIMGRMDKDNAHLAAMNNLWRRAAQSGLSAEAEEQLIRAWLSRARTLVGPVRRKLLAETIGGSEETNKRGKDLPPRVPVSRDRGNARASLSNVDPRKIDYSKTSDEDILDGKVTTRK